MLLLSLINENMSGSGGLRMFHVQGQQKKKLYVSAESCDIFRVQRGELLLFFLLIVRVTVP